MFIAFDRLSAASLGLLIAPCLTVTGIGCGALPSIICIAMEIACGLGGIGFLEGSAPAQMRATLHGLGFLAVILLGIVTIVAVPKSIRKGALAAQTLVHACTWWAYVDSIENATETRPGEVFGSLWVWAAIAIASIVTLIPKGKVQNQPQTTP